MTRTITRIGALAVAFGLAILAAAPIAAHSEQSPTPTATPQTLTVSPLVTIAPMERDSYTVYVPPVVWPLESGQVSSWFGYRVPPTAGASDFHQGVDFAAGAGTPIRSVAEGIVTAAGWDGGLGIAVHVEHVIDGVPVETVYGHMVELPPVVPGQVVARGEVVGYVGSTGVSTGNHLHFEVRYGGEAIDPLPWLYEHAP